ncbi:MAG: Zn-dependent exopeptidase M28 [Aquifex sp.]|nr:MAG: Zn-dependent exopeptidase M28 [Aquifex sp.]
MIGERIKEIQRICEEICWQNRLSGSEGNKRVRRFIKKYLKDKGFKVFTEKFEVSKTFPVSATIKVDGEEFPAIPLIGSLWGEVSGELKVVKDLRKEEDLRGKIVAMPIGGLRDSEKARGLRDKKAAALITFLEELNVPFSGTIGDAKFFAVNTTKEVVKKLEGKKVILNVRTYKKTVRGENLFIEFGRGPIVYLVAHYDTKPFVYGAIDNGLSVAMLLVLAKDLSSYEELPFRIRILFTDCEELGLEGSYHHTLHLKNTLYVINLDSIGWTNPAVIYKDYKGYNGKLINEKFFKHLNDLKVDIPFVESKTGASDHIPFKEKGVEALFLSSNPFTLRHTQLDDYHAIDWEVVKLWYEVVAHFIRRIHRL